MSRHLATALLFTSFLFAQVAAGESGHAADSRFAEFNLASVPLPGTADEVVVDEEQSLELFLSPSDFPDALARLALSGVGADFAVNLDLSTLQGEALPDRVQWPDLGGRPLTISTRSGESPGLALTPVTPRPSISEDELADQELQLQWYIQPEEGEPQGPLRGRVRAVRLATSDDQTLATWIARPPQEGCAESIAPGGGPRCHVSGVSRAVKALAVDISGQWVAVAGGDLRPRVDIWKLSSFSLAHRIAFPPWQGPPLGVEYTHDGRLLVVVDGVGTIHLWNASTGGEHHHFGASAQAFALLDVGRIIAVSNAEGGITLWRTADGTIAARLGGASGQQSQQLVASGDGHRLAAVSHDGDHATVTVWQLDGERVMGRVQADSGIVDVDLDGAGEHLFATHDERGLLKTRVSNSTSFAPFGGEAGRRCRGHIALSSDDSLVACAQNRGAALFDARQGQLVHSFGVDEERGVTLDAIDFSPDGARLLATGNGELLEWPLPQRSSRQR